MKFLTKTGSRHYNTGEINGIFFTSILSVLGFLIIQYTIRTIFPSLYISSYSIINVILAVIFGYFFQLSGSGLVGLIPYLPLARFLFILGVENDFGIKLNFFEIGSFYFPVNILIFLLFFLSPVLPLLTGLFSFLRKRSIHLLWILKDTMNG